MARQTITKTKTTKTRVKKGGANSAYRQCNICHGTGVVRKSSSPKGKKK